VESPSAVSARPSGGIVVIGSYLDVQSEIASDYNYYDYYADDVEDVHLVCSSWNPSRVGQSACPMQIYYT
jgi:hypothetical protein